MNLKEEIARYAKLMFDRGYSVAQEGNISCRFGKDRIAITPSNRMKAFLKKGDIAEIDMNGDPRGGKIIPSSERYTHLEIYRLNPDIRAIVHAHPFFTLLMSALGEDPFRKIFLAESAMFLRDVVLVPFVRPSTKDGAEAVKRLSSGSRIIVMDRHGSFTCGDDVPSAFALLEILEKHCKMVYFAGLSGKELRCFSEEERKALENIQYGRQV